MSLWMNCLLYIPSTSSHFLSSNLWTRKLSCYLLEYISGTLPTLGLFICWSSSLEHPFSIFTWMAPSLEIYATLQMLPPQGGLSDHSPSTLNCTISILSLERARSCSIFIYSLKCYVFPWKDAGSVNIRTLSVLFTRRAYHST